MKRLLAAYLCLTFWCLGTAHAQQDPQFSHYMFNQLYYNPATAGLDSRFIETKVLYRSQWAGYEPTVDGGGAPTTQLFSVSMPLTQLKGGLGLHVINDELGPETRREVQLSFSYHIPVNKGSLSFGVRGGVFNFGLDNSLRYVNPNDPTKPTGSVNEFTPDFGAGLYFDHPNYFVGVSANHLQQSDFDTEVAGFYSLATHFTTLVGMNLDMSSKITLQPSVILKSDFKAYSIEASALAIYDDKAYIGLSARELEAAILMAGAYLTRDKRLTLGYAFDYTLEQKDAKSATSHEIMLSYKFMAPGKAEPSILRTPRFRF
ncbi:type IX secretion system membrane protein PorP/SprF [Limibacter armeniacum]|uniref:PorP/SprF family type IX secretion system membrane protein n=1 Tax=Limibacter armeniacum TaxID=466084 RepID=UPI002FE53E15